MFPLHRISLEPRSGIYLLFYETLITSTLTAQGGVYYEQQLLRIFPNFDRAEKAALFVISDRKIDTPLIVRDDSKKNVRLRKA